MSTKTSGMLGIERNFHESERTGTGYIDPFCCGCGVRQYRHRPHSKEDIVHMLSLLKPRYVSLARPLSFLHFTY